MFIVPLKANYHTKGYWLMGMQMKYGLCSWEWVSPSLARPAFHTSVPVFSSLHKTDVCLNKYAQMKHESVCKENNAVW